MDVLATCCYDIHLAKCHAVTPNTGRSCGRDMPFPCHDATSVNPDDPSAADTAEDSVHIARRVVTFQSETSREQCSRSEFRHYLKSKSHVHTHVLTITTTLDLVSVRAFSL
jgi:hypothetical protein